MDLQLILCGISHLVNGGPSHFHDLYEHFKILFIYIKIKFQGKKMSMLKYYRYIVLLLN